MHTARNAQDGQSYPNQQTPARPRSVSVVRPIRPAVFKVHKKNAALQLSLSPGYRAGENDVVLTPGCLLLEMANAAGQNNRNGFRTYDWEKGKKISIKLTSTDIQQIVMALYTGVKANIVHDQSKIAGSKGGGYKNLYIEKGQQSGYFFTAAFAGKTIRCPLTDGEVWELKVLLNASISRIYGW